METCVRVRGIGVGGWWVLALAGMVASAGAQVAGTYGGSVKATPGLLAYWPLGGSLQAAGGSLELASGKAGLARGAGPLQDAAVDLNDGNWLVVKPARELDDDDLGVELLVEITKPLGGNPCLLALRDEKRTRISVHYNSDSNVLLLYNGKSVTSYQSDEILAAKQWYHVAVGLRGGVVQVWLNGKECAPQGAPAKVGETTGLPLVIGASNAVNGAEHARIKVGHLALYHNPPARGELVKHLTAAGWAAKLKEQTPWQKCPVSILESQIGYHPLNAKHVYLRSAQEVPPEGWIVPEFSVVDTSEAKEVFRGKVRRWGKKWDTYWWVLDFTPLREQGEYYVKCGKLESTPFMVEQGIFHKTDLTVMALDQLEHRIHHGIEDPRRGMKGTYVNAPPGTKIYMDCGSPYSELEPVGTCVYALIEMHDQLGSGYSETDRRRMIELAKLGADYFVAAQRTSDDLEIDGMFYHSLLVNTNDTWAGDFSTYLDTAYGMALLAKAHQFFKDKDPERAGRYLAGARRAWRLCAHRPYHTKADRTFPKGCNAYFWNAPAGIQETFARCFYNILDPEWKMPDSLRTRDRLPFIQGSALLYEITGETRYFDKALEFADVVMERQFTDWENPIEGCYGTFYEFEGNDEAFFHEFMQGGFWWEGNVEALNLEGFMHLLRLAPRHRQAAAWMNTVKTYAENYARRSVTLNPLGIYPVACYRDPKHGGLKNFQNTLMGSSCVFGFSAKNFMMLGDFLQDSRYQVPALAGINFIAGLNPGIPNAYEETAWDARTLIQGVGRSWFGPAGDVAETARGSVPNGFCAAPQFWQPTWDNYISYQTDAPRGMVNKGGGLQFNEGWILHSHAYVHGVSRLEAPYLLEVRTYQDGKPVDAAVAVELTEVAAPHGAVKRRYQTGAGGVLALRDLPTPCEGTARISYQGREVVRAVAAIAGGRHVAAVDFARDVDVRIGMPEALRVRGRGEATVTVANTGSGDVALKIGLSGSGLKLAKEEWDVAVAAGATKEWVVPFECGDRVMPCLIRARINDGAPAREFHAGARIGSK